MSKRTAAQTPRSNIQAGTSRQRSDVEPPILQRIMFAPTRSTVSWTCTRRPAQGCHWYKISRTSVPWAFRRRVVQRETSSHIAWLDDAGRICCCSGRKGGRMNAGNSLSGWMRNRGTLMNAGNSPSGRMRNRGNLKQRSVSGCRGMKGGGHVTTSRSAHDLACSPRPNAPGRPICQARIPTHHRRRAAPNSQTIRS